MDEFYTPGKKHTYVKVPRPLTENERFWSEERTREWWKDRYCQYCEYRVDIEGGGMDCFADDCPTCASVEALNDGLRFMQLVLEDICAGEEHDKPCSHVPRNLSCPYKSDEHGEKPCYWCDHKERLIRIDELMSN